MKRLRLGPATADRCRRRIHLDHDPDADTSRRRGPDAAWQLRRDRRAEHRRAVLAAVTALYDVVPDWTLDDPRRPPVVGAARLAAGARVATPDLLVRAPDGGYLPVLIRGHRTTDPGGGAPVSTLDAPLAVSSSPTRRRRSHHEDALALAHIYRLLDDLGLASTAARGGIIGRGGPAADPGWDDADLIVWHDLGDPADPTSVLADYDARFADRVAVATAAATRRPALARPSRIAECRRCPWWPVCGPQLERAHDISLLVSGRDVVELRALGIDSYDRLAAMTDAELEELPITGIAPAEAGQRARVLLADLPLARRGEHADTPRADIELDIDMESYSDDGAYLWGTYLSGPAVAELPDPYRPGYRPFVTWEDLDSGAAGENFVAFWSYLTTLRRLCADRGWTFAAYCYSHRAEERWLYGTPERFPDLPGMPDRAEVARFCASDQWVDLHREVGRLFVVPGSSRLKTVAAIAGFTWRDPEPGGENSMAWYRWARGADDPAVRDAHRTRILRYNEDDVRATLTLRRWISERAAQVPVAADLPATAAASAATRPGG